MIKIFITIRNRLAITKFCIESIIRHTSLPKQLYIYNNLSNYKVKEHFDYMYDLYSKGIITQITINTRDSTFNAFSKAVACNQFGFNHEIDPNKDKYNYLVFLDNDIVVFPKWDLILRDAWVDINKMKMKDVKVIGQHPGGIKYKSLMSCKVAGYDAVLGKLGGSALWSVRPNFFSDVGILDVKRLVGHDKRHDQEYWQLMEKSNRGKEYIVGLKAKLGVHCNYYAGSVCNILSKNRMHPRKDTLIHFEKSEEELSKYTFEQFWEQLKNRAETFNEW